MNSPDQEIASGKDLAGDHHNPQKDLFISGTQVISINLKLLMREIYFKGKTDQVGEHSQQDGLH
jgi:hypothetical protein